MVRNIFTHSYEIIDVAAQTGVINAYVGADVIMYKDNTTDYIHFQCSSGLSGEVNDGVTMNITFANVNLSCSQPTTTALYLEQYQLE